MKVLRKKEVEYSVLLKNHPVKKLDDILKSSFRDKNKSSEINFDRILKKLHRKLWGFC